MLGQLLGDVYRDAGFIVDGATVQGGKIMWESKVVDDKTPERSWSTETVPDGKLDGMKAALIQRLSFHIDELDKRDKDIAGEIQKEEGEQKKKITSEDIRDGWSKSSVVAPKPSPLEDRPNAGASSKGKGKAKEKVETIEVLNPGPAAVRRTLISTMHSIDAQTQPPEEEEEQFGPLTPTARAFANIPLSEFQRSYAFIQKDSSVLTEATHDSLLAEAFDAERRGDKGMARRCVHQSLLINYCRQLGRDGVGLFFQK